MSQAELINQGLILKRKNERYQAIADGKAALRSLINDATHSQDKGIPDINSTLLQSHLTRLIEKQADIARLDAEIAELEY